MAAAELSSGMLLRGTRVDDEGGGQQSRGHALQLPAGYRVGERVWLSLGQRSGERVVPGELLKWHGDGNDWVCCVSWRDDGQKEATVAWYSGWRVVPMRTHHR